MSYLPIFWGMNYDYFLALRGLMIRPELPSIFRIRVKSSSYWVLAHSASSLSFSRVYSDGLCSHALSSFAPARGADAFETLTSIPGRYFKSFHLETSMSCLLGFEINASKSLTMVIRGLRAARTSLTTSNQLRPYKMGW